MSRPKGVKSRTQHIWSQEEKEYLKDICSGRSYKEIAEIMTGKFNREYTVGIITGAMKRYNLKNGRDCCFKKNITPWNKGMKGLVIEGTKKTWFKKGDMPVNHRVVGSERVNVDGYTEVKVKEPNVWKLKHRVKYIEYHGEIKKGYVVIFADGDKSNFSKENLIAITRNQLKVMNQNNLIKDNIESTQVGVKIAEVIIKISEKNKEIKGKI